MSNCPESSNLSHAASFNGDCSSMVEPFPPSVSLHLRGRRLPSGSDLGSTPGNHPIHRTGLSFGAGLYVI